MVSALLYIRTAWEKKIMKLVTQRVTLEVSDGTSMNAYTVRPAEEGKFPGMPVFQEAFGMNVHIRDITERIARPSEQIRTLVDELKRIGKPHVNVEISDADHGFFCDARASYNPVAAALAWTLSLKFLDVQVKGSGQKAQVA